MASLVNPPAELAAIESQPFPPASAAAACYSRTLLARLECAAERTKCDQLSCSTQEKETHTGCCTSCMEEACAAAVIPACCSQTGWPPLAPLAHCSSIWCMERYCQARGFLQVCQSQGTQQMAQPAHRCCHECLDRLLAKKEGS